MVRRSLRRAGSVRDALPEGWEWSEDSPVTPGVVGRHSQKEGEVGRPSRRAGCARAAGSGCEAHPKGGSGWKALPELREWSAGPPGGLGVVGRPSQKGRDYL